MLIDDMLSDVVRQGDVLDLSSPNVFRKLINVGSTFHFDEGLPYKKLSWFINPNFHEEFVVPPSPQSPLP